MPAMVMSAFVVAIGGKADMALCTAHVRFCPKADIDKQTTLRYCKSIG
jgi:hypothetical protein